jgi:hypothetical protein
MQSRKTARSSPLAALIFSTALMCYSGEREISDGSMSQAFSTTLDCLST